MFQNHNSSIFNTQDLSGLVLLYNLSVVNFCTDTLSVAFVLFQIYEIIAQFVTPSCWSIVIDVVFGNGNVHFLNQRW